MRVLVICVALSAAVSVVYSSALVKSQATRLDDKAGDKNSDIKQLSLAVKLSALKNKKQEKVSEARGDWNDQLDAWIDECGFNEDPDKEDECRRLYNELMEDQSYRSQIKKKMENKFLIAARGLKEKRTRQLQLARLWARKISTRK